MAMDHLRKAQWDQLFMAVHAAGFTPLVDIVRSPVPGELLGYSNEVPGLLHKPTNFYFAIAELPEPRGRLGMGSGPFGVAFAPAAQTREGGFQYVTFEQVLIACKGWLKRVHEDSGPDLWTLAAQNRALLGPVAGTRDLGNAPFTVDERQRIAESLDALQADIIKTQELSAAQTTALGAGIADLKASSGRMGRKDWLVNVYGTFMAVALAAAFAPEQAKHLWQLAGQVLGWVFGGVPLLPR